MKFNEMITKIINRKFKYLKGIKSNTFLDLYLKENNLIKDDDLSLLYSELLNLPLYKGSTNKKTLVEIISLDLMEKTKTIYYENDDSVIVLTTNPLDNNIDENLITIDKETIINIITETEFQNLFKIIKYNQVDLTYALVTPEIPVIKEEQKIAYEDVKVSVNVQLVNKWLNKAIILGASDIHLEPGEEYCLIRIRVDGKLIIMEKIIKGMYDELVSRIKIMSNLDITQKLLPQDGKFTYLLNDKKYDIRTSTINTVFGEKVVLRVLENKTIKNDFSILQYTKEEEAKIKNLLKSDNGVILVTGPTGSGKTTTLYTFLSELKSDETNIVTLEDPVEYTIPGINQVQVNHAIGLGFNKMLRNILRQDPNIVMIGEIRDEETAQMAMRSAISGLLVLSTIHTNYAVGTIIRLLDMGIPKYLVSSAVRGIISQKLVRKLCPKCKKEIKLTNEEKSQKGLIEDTKIYVKGGCEECYYTGYSGRILLSEILIFDDKIKSMILHNYDENELKKYVQTKMVTLDQKLKKAISLGIVSFEEIK